MRDYLIRRLLLIPPTLLGVTLVIFFITRITPGGPLEKAMQAAMAKATSGSGGGSARDGGGGLSEEQKQRMAEYFGQDKSFFPAWATWLGAWPREVDKIREEAPEGAITAVTLRQLLPKAQWIPTLLAIWSAMRARPSHLPLKEQSP